MEAVVVDAEVVAELVDDSLADLLANFIVIAADSLDRLLVDADLVGQDEIVVLAAMGDGNAMVEPEEGSPGPQSGHLPVARSGTAFDNYLDVLHALKEVAGKGRYRFAHKIAKALAFQVATSALPPRPRGYGTRAR